MPPTHPPTPRFATCSYSEFDPDMGIPVRATLGPPRFAPHLGHINLQQAAPDRAWFSAPEAEFDRRYFEKLNRIGVKFFKDWADRTSDGTRTLVLLCFERVWKDACHRTLFAQWWTEQTGEEVPELGATTPPLDAPKPKVAVTPPPKLF